MTKNKPTYALNNQKPLQTHGDVNGPVITYIMPPDELEKYRSMPKHDYEKEKKLNRPFGGGAA